MSLEKYTDEQLEDEIRYRKERKLIDENIDRTNFKWCDGCENWKSATAASRENYNPCQKKQKMLFIEPRDIGDIEWGFYRDTCKHWGKKPEPIVKRPPTTKYFGAPKLVT